MFFRSWAGFVSCFVMLVLILAIRVAKGEGRRPEIVDMSTEELYEAISKGRESIGVEVPVEDFGVPQYVRYRINAIEKRLKKLENKRGLNNETVSVPGGGR